MIIDQFHYSLTLQTFPFKYAYAGQLPEIRISGLSVLLINMEAKVIQTCYCQTIGVFSTTCHNGLIFMKQKQVMTHCYLVTFEMLKRITDLSIICIEMLNNLLSFVLVSGF
jgi:hypothetical protein